VPQIHPRYLCLEFCVSLTFATFIFSALESESSMADSYYENFVMSYLNLSAKNVFAACLDSHKENGIGFSPLFCV